MNEREKSSREVASCMFDAMFLKCTTYGAGHCYNTVLLMSVNYILYST